MADLRVLREVVTPELRVGDQVAWQGEHREVVELHDTGTPALYGEGSAWQITLRRPTGEDVPMQAAASKRWTRV